ncbi:MAG TPA: hypothetical protein VK034_16785 [Enhygromyxa sp.]|nr:hypothetical protein [Enhygromyxa sp.]
MTILASVLGFALFEPPQPVEPEPPVSLSWQAPSECPGREQALERLRELMPELPEQVPDERGRIAVTVEIADTTATVRFAGPRGVDERTLRGSTCEIVAKAVVMVVAVAVEAEAEAEAEAKAPVEAEERQPAEPEPVEPVEPAEPGPVEPREPIEVSVEPPLDDYELRPRIRGHAGVLGGGGLGPLDVGMGAVVLEVGVHGRRWRASARGVWIPPRTIALADDPTLMGRYDGGLGGVRACFASPFGEQRVELPLCAGFEAGVLRGRGVGSTPAPDTATQPWAAVELGPGLRYVPNRRVALGLEVDLVAALLRGGFTLGGSIAQRHAPIGVRALAGLELRFP